MVLNNIQRGGQASTSGLHLIKVKKYRGGNFCSLAKSKAKTQK